MILDIYWQVFDRLMAIFGTISLLDALISSFCLSLFTSDLGDQQKKDSVMGQLFYFFSGAAFMFSVLSLLTEVVMQIGFNKIPANLPSMRAFVRSGVLVFHGVGGYGGFLVSLLCIQVAICLNAYVRVHSWVVIALVAIAGFIVMFFALALVSMENFARLDLASQSGKKQKR